MLMSDTNIRSARHMGWLDIEPYDPEMLQPASIDIRLGTHFTRYIVNHYSDPPEGGYIIDPTEDNHRMTEQIVIPSEGAIKLYPGEFLLAHTVETITLSSRIAARLEGRSSYARLGLIVHSTAGFIDPGFTGQITLELSNLAPHPIVLRPGIRVGQICFIPCVSAADVPYGIREGSKYQGQTHSTPSLAYRDKW